MIYAVSIVAQGYGLDAIIMRSRNRLVCALILALWYAERAGYAATSI
jgi:hypothetical protein